MNKVFLMLCIGLSSIPILGNEDKDLQLKDNFRQAQDCDPCPLSQEQERYIKSLRKIEKKCVVSLLLAFKALRHKVMNNNNPTPYSREYIDHICSEEFLQLMERILDKKTRKPIDIWAIIKSYFSHYKKHSV